MPVDKSTCSKYCRCAACQARRQAERERRKGLCYKGKHPVEFTCGVGTRRRCRLCEEDALAEQRLEELRWLNSPPIQIQVPAVTATTKCEIWNGTGEDARETRHSPPRELWTEILRKGRVPKRELSEVCMSLCRTGRRLAAHHREMLKKHFGVNAIRLQRSQRSGLSGRNV